MPFHELAVTPADVDGAALGLAINAPAPTALASVRLTHPDGGALVLGVLGASHVVTVEHSHGRFTEEVSCSASAHGDVLPASADAPGYHLASQVTHYPATEFTGLAARLRDSCAADPHRLGGQFPGDGAALTALSAQPDGSGWAWQTWHLYPDDDGGTAVSTTSRWYP
ncbi:MAG: DUF2617 family protein [Mycobacterium sp.]